MTLGTGTPSRGVKHVPVPVVSKKDFDTWVQRLQLSTNATMRKNGDAYDTTKKADRDSDGS